MEILICDYCYHESPSTGKIVEAIDVLPETVLSLSRRKIGPVGICAAHASKLLPDYLASSGAKRSATKLARPYHKTKANGADKSGLADLPTLEPRAQYVGTTALAKILGLNVKSMGYRIKTGEITPVGQWKAGYVFDTKSPQIKALAKSSHKN